MAFRIDMQGRLDGAKKTSQGGLLVPANLTRTGVFLYDGPGGTIVRELRHPDEVFKADSLASLRSAPGTVYPHPAKVTADNYKALTVGHVDGDARRDGDFVAATLRINDADAVKRIDAKELVELSCGYSCDVVNEPGEYNGQKYDGRQTNIEYNHWTMGPTNWGRAGNEVKLRLDSSEDSTTLVGHYNQLTAIITANKQDSMPDPTLSTPPITHSDAAYQGLLGQNAALTSQVATLTTDLAQARDSKRMDSLVNERVSLVTKVVSVLGPEYKADGKSDLAVMTDAILKLDPSQKLDGKSVEYVTGVFASTISRADAVAVAQAAAHKATPTIETTHADGSDPLLEAQNAHSYRSVNMWRGDGWLEKHPYTKEAR